MNESELKTRIRLNKLHLCDSQRESSKFGFFLSSVLYQFRWFMHPQTHPQNALNLLETTFCPTVHLALPNFSLCFFLQISRRGFSSAPRSLIMRIQALKLVIGGVACSVFVILLVFTLSCKCLIFINVF